jgi:hypothetical protein
MTFLPMSGLYFRFIPLEGLLPVPKMQTPWRGGVHGSAPESLPRAHGPLPWRLPACAPPSIGLPGTVKPYAALLCLVSHLFDSYFGENLPALSSLLNEVFGRRGQRQNAPLSWFKAIRFLFTVFCHRQPFRSGTRSTPGALGL